MSKLSAYKSYFENIVSTMPAISNFVFGYMERPIEGTHNELRYPLFHLHPPTFRLVDNDSNYFAVKACGTFVIWCLGDTDDWQSQDDAWDLSMELSLQIVKQMQHDCDDGLIDDFDQNQCNLDMVKPAWVDRSRGWEVYFEFQLPANDELC